MKLGVIADAHLRPVGTGFPSVLGFPSVPYEYEKSDDILRYRRALRRCVEEGVNGLVLLGDLSRTGDAESLETGLRLAARTGLPVWAVSGNHECYERVDALDRAVRWIGAENVRLGTPAGEVVGVGQRIAGLGVTSENHGYTARSDERPDVRSWGDDFVVWLSHYPMISFTEEATEAGLNYSSGDDLENLDEVARALLERPSPTVVVNGHLHLRDARAEGKVLQISCAALMEAPFEISLLDFDLEGGRISVHVESVQITPTPDDAPLPVLSSPEQEWIFEAGAWRLVAPVELRKEAAG